MSHNTVICMLHTDKTMKPGLTSSDTMGTRVLGVLDALLLPPLCEEAMRHSSVALAPLLGTHPCLRDYYLWTSPRNVSVTLTAEDDGSDAMKAVGAITRGKAGRPTGVHAPCGVRCLIVRGDSRSMNLTADTMQLVTVLTHIPAHFPTALDVRCVCPASCGALLGTAMRFHRLSALTIQGMTIEGELAVPRLPTLAKLTVRDVTCSMLSITHLPMLTQLRVDACSGTVATVSGTPLLRQLRSTVADDLPLNIPPITLTVQRPQDCLCLADVTLCNSGPVSWLAQATAITALRWRGVDMQELATAVLPGLTACLSTLDVSNNDLSGIPAELPAALTTLNVSDNKLATLPATLPASLTHLDVSGNQLLALPDALPAALMRLDAPENKLTALPTTLPSSLTHLDVSGNKLTKLPVTLPAALMHLDAPENKLTALPATLPASLTHLSVSHNKLRTLPAQLPASLIRLDASENKLATIPDTLPVSLTHLGVSNNKLGALPATLPASLTHLDVSHNNISTLPDTLPVALKCLDVASNQLAALPDTLPATLMELTAYNNQLTILPARLPATLTVLTACHNQLTTLPEELPARLTRLNVSHNRLSHLTTILPAALAYLDVCGNPVRTLSMALPAKLQVFLANRCGRLAQAHITAPQLKQVELSDCVTLHTLSVQSNHHRMIVRCSSCPALVLVKLPAYGRFQLADCPALREVCTHAA